MTDRNETAPTDDHATVSKLIKDTRVAMMTYTDGEGRLVSQPMATQDVEFDGTCWFITERDSEKVRQLAANPQVNLAYAGKGSWVSLSGRAHVVEDNAKLAELWGTFTGTWLEGGPDNPNNVLLRVDGDTAEYWAAPGNSTVIALANLVKSKATGQRMEGDNKVVDL